MSETAEQRPKFIWLMGLSNATYGFVYAVVLVTVPHLLATRGVAEPRIAALTALAMTASIATFLVAPVLDTLISRRSWSFGLAFAAVIMTFGVLAIPTASPMLAPALAADVLLIALFNSAIGGWLGAALPKSSDTTLGAWFTIGNAVGFGLGAQCQYWLMTHLPTLVGAAIIAGAALAPLAILPMIPADDVDRKAVRESFGRLARDVASLLRLPLVLRLLLLFVLPCAAFTLTNAFGGLGRDFQAPDSLVDLANGVGGIAVGLAGSLAARVLMQRVTAPLLYLATGSLGAAFTLALLALKPTPAIYLLAVLGENAAQSLAQVSQSAIIFGSIPPASPLASSQYALLSTAATIPYAYMQMLDGYGYKLAGGVAGSFLMDAGVSLAACALLALPVAAWLRAGKLQAVALPNLAA